MKYCVSARQLPHVLKKVNEVRVLQRDLKGIPNLANEYSNLKFIYELSTQEEIDWKTFNNYNKVYDITIALKNISLLNYCKEQNYKCFWDYPITSYTDFNMICKNQDIIKEILIGAPLFFNLKYIRNNFQGKIRAIPNLAIDNYLAENNFNSILGTFIRPDDIKDYEPYIDTMEFVTDSLKKEETLLKIYQEDQQWLGNLNLLIKNLNYNIDNRALPEEFGNVRLNCKQKCLEGRACHFCEDAFLFADAVRKESVIRKKALEIDI